MKYTKDQLMLIAREGDLPNQGNWINTDDLECFYGLNNLAGEKIGVWLESLGFTVISCEDKGTNGLVTTAEGLKMSTNGYTWI